MGGLKSSSKLIAAGILMGGRAKLASHIVSKTQGVDNGSEYILMEDFGLSLARFDSVESSTDGSTKRWFPGFRNPILWSSHPCPLSYSCTLLSDVPSKYVSERLAYPAYLASVDLGHRSRDPQHPSLHPTLNQAPVIP